MSFRSLRSIIAERPAVVASRQTSVRDAAGIMQRHNVGALVVVDGRRLVGIFTERDALFRVVAAGKDPNVTRLDEVMTRGPQTIHPDQPFLEALCMMREGRYRHLPVVEDDRPLGMVSVRDALDEDLHELRILLAHREDRD